MKVIPAGTVPATPPDVVVLACKEPALAEALDAVTPLLGAADAAAAAAQRRAPPRPALRALPGTPLLGGIIHGAANLRPDGVIEHLSSFMTVITGPVATASDPVADEFVARLKSAGVEAYATHEIRQDMWNKFVFLAAFAGITCLMRADIGTILQTDGGRARILHLLEETRAVARAEGYEPPEAMMDEYRALLTKEGSTLTSSMLRDIESGRRTEGNHILGDMLARARKHELPAPVLAIAAAHVQAYEKRLTLKRFRPCRARGRRRRRAWPAAWDRAPRAA